MQERVECVFQVAQRMEQLQEECQRYMQSIRQKSKHLKITRTKEVKQKTDPSVAGWFSHVHPTSFYIQNVLNLDYSAVM